jgi:hypothetical protein
MAGTSPPLVCDGFIETETYERSKDLLRQRLELTDRQLDDRLEALIWALQRDREGLVARRVPDRDLWVAVTDHPYLRIYLRPRAGVAGECELLWIEEVD